LNALYLALTGQPAYADIDVAFQEIASTIPGYAGMTIAGLGDDGAIRTVAGTPTFVPVAPAVAVSGDGKLALVTGSALNHSGTLSLYGEGPMLVCPEGYLELNRADAKTLSVKDGEMVTVKSVTGEVRLKAKVGSRLPQGVVFAPYHFAHASINNVTTGSAVTWVSVGK
jgi:predicted molibdopterin-dependent oxidoreductase YjgC